MTTHSGGHRSIRVKLWAISPELRKLVEKSLYVLRHFDSGEQDTLTMLLEESSKFQLQGEARVFLKTCPARCAANTDSYKCGFHDSWIC